jgi:exodeoxyribonuclease VIII
MAAKKTEAAEVPADENNQAPAFVATPGIHMIDNEVYHGCLGVPSKSGLQTINQKSPFHFRFGEREEKRHFALGDGAHAAILEPERFETQFQRGPLDRRGNKWTDTEAQAKAAGRTLLTDGEYNIALRVRDSAHRNPTVRKIVAGAVVEPSGFFIDPETGILCRVRPDAYNPGIRIIGDVKTTTDASPMAFAKSVAEYGYHVQEAMYSEGFPLAAQVGGMDWEVDGFAFIVVEKTAPYLVAVYELEPSAVAEGYALYRQGLEAYARCAKAEDSVRTEFRAREENGADMSELDHALRNCWPAYGDGVQRLDIPRWAYRLTSNQPA